MIGEWPVGLTLIVGGLLAAVTRGRLRDAVTIVAPLLLLAQLVALAPGDYAQLHVLGRTLVLMHVDRLSLLFGYVFAIATLLGAIYALHADDMAQRAAAPIYAGCAVAAVFAGDLFSLFVFWELSAIASVLLIWARRTERAYGAGMRYIAVQLVSGMLLLAGALVHEAASGSLTFGYIGLAAPGGVLLLIAFGIKASFPLLHNWLQDAYPEATEAGTVVLSSFTTKLGIYALARAFPGTELLIWIGTAMTAFPIFYAVIENDLRRVLAYSMTNQLGFMVVGVGIGTELALNGAVAHAFADIIFKALLFMSMGAVLLRAGTVNGTSLGGLYKSMPWTTGFCIVGAASISAFPLFSAFVTKSMIMEAAVEQGHVGVWLVLLFASAGVFHHAGIKIPYFAFFAHDSGIRCKEAPASMLVAMALAAALCIGIGVFPDALYSILPWTVDYKPYTSSHVLSQLQLLVFSAMAFAVLMRTGIYPAEMRAINMDSDWIYRRLGPDLAAAATSGLSRGLAAFGTAAQTMGGTLLRWNRFWHGPDGALARTLSTGAMALWISALLAVYLVMYYA
jgi:multicomponent Na+:H+ antiporter subunit D